MKPQAILGLILIVAGILILVYQGIPFTKKNTAEIGPVKLEEKHTETEHISPIIGAVSVAGGIFLVVLGSRK